jgi:hypothetical protein
LKPNITEWAGIPSKKHIYEMNIIKIINHKPKNPIRFVNQALRLIAKIPDHAGIVVNDEMIIEKIIIDISK